jgi:hypothetical protein
MSSKVKLRADASAAAGPKGRDTSAETDVVISRDPFIPERRDCLLGYPGRLDHALDDDANKALYGRRLVQRYHA